MDSAGFRGGGAGHRGGMTLLTDGRPAPPTQVDLPIADGPGTGFRDCRGVWHRLDREDDGSRD
ncbi:hypothetical protein GCM10012276_10690 [Nocardioides deserti]|nr:hypothetical protein GCM10012276_10690 [Nocardioides deserti]